MLSALSSEFEQPTQIGLGQKVSGIRKEGSRSILENTAGIREDGRINEVEEKIKKREIRPISVTIPIALQEHQHIILLGDAGSGKTTTIQFITHCFAVKDKKLAEEKLGLSEDRVPIMISLKEVLEEARKREIKHEGLDDWLADAVSVEMGADMSQSKEVVDGWIKAGRLIILLDGLDEIADELRTEVVKKIDRFSSTNRGMDCRIVITSRKEGYKRVGANFYEYALLPLTSNKEIKTYVIGWILALKSEYSEDQANNEALFLSELAKSNPSLSQVMTNPLLLRLLISQHLSDGGIPENRADLLRYYVDEEAWKRAKKREPFPPMQSDVGLALEIIAWKLHTLRENDFGILAEAVQNEIPSTKDGKEILQFIINAMGLLVLRGTLIQRRVDFIPLILQGYFVARCLKRAWKIDENRTWTFLKPLLHHPNWKEPIMLLLHMLGEEDATLLVEQIWKANSSYEEILHRDVLLVGECLKDGVLINRKLRKEILDNLLILYLFHKPPALSSPIYSHNLRLQRIVAKSVKSLFGSLSISDKAQLASYLLPIAKDIKRTRVPYLSSFKQFVDERFRHHRYLVKGITQELPSLINKIKGIFVINIGYLLTIFSLPFLILSYVDQVKTSRNVQRLTAIETLIILKYLSKEWIDFLISALKDPYLCGISAEVLGNIGPYNQEAFHGFCDLLYKDNFELSGSREKVIEALGVYGQRYSEVVNGLIELVKDSETWPRVRHRCIVALCKSAEVSLQAMEFIFDISNYIRADAGKAIDDGSLEGYTEGLGIISTASKEIVLYLFQILENQENVKYIDAGGILFNLFGNYRDGKSEFGGRGGFYPATHSTTDNDIEGSNSTIELTYDTPLLQCKVISDDGLITYVIEDFTEQVFWALINFRKEILYENPFLKILIYWGWKKKDIIERMISTVLTSDHYILAKELEHSLSTNLFLNCPIKHEIQTLLEDRIKSLRDPNQLVRDEAYQFWLSLSQQVTEKSPLHRLAERIEFIKWNTLEDSYKIASSSNNRKGLRFQLEIV